MINDEFGNQQMEHFSQISDTTVWKVEDPYLITFTDLDFAQSVFSKETETRFFDPE